MDDVKKGWLTSRFCKRNSFNIVDTSVKNQTISVTKVRTVVTKIGELNSSDLLPPECHCKSCEDGVQQNTLLLVSGHSFRRTYVYEALAVMSREVNDIQMLFPT